ncbi:MAG: hypothetical protein ACK46Q_01865 [Hyphomonas sp.]
MKARLWASSALAACLLLTGVPAAAAYADPVVTGDAPLCPGADKFNVDAIRKENAKNAANRAETIARLASATPLPPGAEATETRIRVRVPDTAMWPWDTRLTLWKDTGGIWRIATNTIRYNEPPPPPHPPPPPLDEEGNPLWAWEPAPEPVPKPPYLTSALAPEQAADLDQRLADPCFRSGPDNYSYALPLRQWEKQNGPDWICPPDSAFYSAEVKLPGEPVRYISHACYLDFAPSTFLRFAAYLTTQPPAGAD